jgi:hypothetical protein
MDLGEEIDAHDQVMRMKASKALLGHPHIFGSRVDMVVGSFVAAIGVLADWKDLCKNYFLFIDTRTEGVDDAGIIHMRDRIFGTERACVIDKTLCTRWIGIYRALRNPIRLDEAQETKGHLSDERGHKHFSIGLFSILHAMEFLSPAEITLYGFDNVASGEFTWSVTRGPDYKQYPDHNWMAEHVLLGDMCAAYDYGIESMPNGGRLKLTKAVSNDA